MALSCCKKLSALLREITSNHVGNFYCQNFFIHLVQKINLKEHENVCKHDYCYIEMSKKGSILNYIMEKCL